jgi:hypothetical protein
MSTWVPRTSPAASRCSTREKSAPAAKALGEILLDR